MTSRVALVTGGTGGIGTAMVKRLARAGHRVATNYRNEEKAREWQAALKADGIDCLIVPGDVADFASSQAMIKEIEAQLGGVDILINNAGITRDTTFHRMSPVQWSDVIATNLTGCYNVTRSVIEGMRAPFELPAAQIASQIVDGAGRRWRGWWREPREERTSGGAVMGHPCGGGEDPGVVRVYSGRRAGARCAARGFRVRGTQSLGDAHA